MFLYVAKHFTSYRRATRLQNVVCEKCGGKFCYELARVGSGRSSAPYYLFQGRAAQRAEDAAGRDLARRLEREAELVPCPKCHWISDELVRKYRQSRYRHAYLWIIGFCFVGVLMVPFMIAESGGAFGHHSPAATLVMQIVIAVCLSSPIWILLIRHQLRSRLDPNEIYPRVPQVPIGTPPALVEVIDRASGESRLQPVRSELADTRAQSRWAILRADQFEFPLRCCVCMSPATTSYRSVLKITESGELPVPCCQPCQTKLRRQWWLLLLAATFISYLVGIGISGWIPRIDALGRNILTAAICFFGMVFGATFAGLACRPYRIKMVDRQRAITKFAASNPDYTALMIEQARGTDGKAALASLNPADEGLR